MKPAKNLKLGIYKHYKGKSYEVIGIARHSEKPNEEFVVYQALYSSKFGKNSLWVRPKEMFLEDVDLKGRKVPRFKLTTKKVKPK
jgi:hypothetical protein